MLHSESWKGGSQSYCSLTILTLFFFSLSSAILGCKNFEHSNADSVANIYFHSHVDSAKICLLDFIKKEKDTIEADKQTKVYYSNDGDWMWAGSEEMLKRCDTVVEYIKEHISDIGFKKDEFFIDTLMADIHRLKHIEQDSAFDAVQAMARVELHMTKAYLRYSIGQHFGFIDPRKVFNHIDKDNRGGYRSLFDISVNRPDSNFIKKAVNSVEENEAVEFLTQCEPTDKNYLLLKDALHKDSIEGNCKKLLLNMERCRWQIIDNPLQKEKFIFVNVPAQNLWAVNTDSVLSMRICCGAFRTKTPLLTSKINLVQFNPEWGIPMSIIRNEVSAHAGDSAYFARHRYFIIHNGDTVNPKDVTPAQLRSGGYRISQKSGPGNSLGRIIFRFPNNHDVYLHDTNQPGAFKNDRRTISHGCVRVQRPFDLMQFVLSDLDEWTTEKIRLSIDIKPETEKGKKYLREYLKEHADDDKPIRLVNSIKTNPQTPVYIGYFTAFPNPDTKEIEFWSDRYEFDEKMEIVLKPFLN